jgi:hypothetical protein
MIPSEQYLLVKEIRTGLGAVQTYKNELPIYPEGIEGSIKIILTA